MDTELVKEYYPGSRKPIDRLPTPTSQNHGGYYGVDPGWDNKPREYTMNGVKQDFFTIGQLALALGRRPVTMRLWEREGIIPKATYQVSSETANGRRRLYSRAQIEGLVVIAIEEGIIISHQRPISATNFTARAVELFKNLAANKGGDST